MDRTYNKRQADLNFQTLSCGYIGLNSNQMTLNSKFYGIFLDKFLKKEENMSPIIILPQRIPRSDFFKEMISLETKFFRKNFREIKNIVKSSYLKSSNEFTLKKDPGELRKLINLLNLLIRLGCFNIKIEIPFYEGIQNSLELEIVKETFAVEKKLSCGKKISVSRLISLYDQYLNGKNGWVTDREEIILLNRIVVDYFRHIKTDRNNNKIIKLSHVFLKKLRDFESPDFLNLLYTSIGYRGLAMVSSFGQIAQKDFLFNAINLAKNLASKSKINQIIASENLYTCFQTLAKWHIQEKNTLAAEKIFQEMVEIDPFDSTAYSELGFLLSDLKRYEEASENFKKAMSLGSPGIGMNTYYYAYCLRLMGKKREAVDYLYMSSKFDKKAISPLLDILEILDPLEKRDEISKIAKKIFETPVLKGQLTDEEITHIKNILV